jgi:hypothetical protein
LADFGRKLGGELGASSNTSAFVLRLSPAMPLLAISRLFELLKILVEMSTCQCKETPMRQKGASSQAERFLDIDAKAQYDPTVACETRFYQWTPTHTRLIFPRQGRAELSDCRRRPD